MKGRLSYMNEELNSLIQKGAFSMTTLSIKYKLLLVLFILNFVATLAFTIYSCIDEKNDAITAIDRKLLAIANGANLIVGEGFRNRIYDKAFLSDEQQIDILRQLTKYATLTNVKYIYFCILKDGKIYIAASSILATQEEIGDNSYKIFELYDTAPLSLKTSFIDGEMRFDEYNDKYGSFRSVFLPLRNDHGDLYITAVDLGKDYITNQLIETLRDTIIIGIGAFFLMLIVQYKFISREIRPLVQLSDLTREMVSKNFEQDKNIINKLLEVGNKSCIEIMQLSNVLSSMYNALQKYIADLKTTTAAHERVESELSIAHDIQMGMLPRKFPAFPNRTEFDLHAIMEPARTVGGDLYDYFLISNDKLFLAIGDVSDKGIPAALFMAVTKTLLKSHLLSKNGDSINQILRRLNFQLMEENSAQMFVTLFAALLDLRTGELEFVNCGHEPPIILKTGGEINILKGNGETALCVLDDVSYTTRKLRLEAGDSMILYTDGLTDAINGKNERFKLENIERTVRRIGGGTEARIINEELLAEIKTFSENAYQFDDMTILTVRFIGEGEHVKVAWRGGNAGVKTMEEV
jgi:phosphoserine phosphatase RsbU/P